MSVSTCKRIVQHLKVFRCIDTAPCAVSCRSDVKRWLAEANHLLCLHLTHPKCGAGDLTALQHADVAVLAAIMALLPIENADEGEQTADEQALGAA